MQSRSECLDGLILEEDVGAGQQGHGRGSGAADRAQSWGGFPLLYALGSHTSGATATSHQVQVLLQNKKPQSVVRTDEHLT